MGRRERDPQAATDEHHDDAWNTGVVGEVFGMSRESDAGIVDDAFLDRGGDHRIELALETARDSAIENGKYVARVAGVQLSRHRRDSERNMLDVRTALQKRAVAEDDDFRRRGFARNAGTQL